MTGLKGFLWLSAILFAGELFSAEAVPVNNEGDKILFYDDFSTWNIPGEGAADFDSDGMFPVKWLSYSRNDEKGVIRKNISVDNGKENPSILLNGRIITKELIKDLSRDKILKISFKAKGERANLLISMHEIKMGGGAGGHNEFVDEHPSLSKVKEKGEVTVAVAEVANINTAGEWKEYSTEMKMLPFGGTVARLEIKADNVLVDDLLISISEVKEEKWEQPVFTIPLLKRKPAIDGSIDPEEWKGALFLSNPFKNIATGMSVCRETSVRMFSDENNIYIAISAGIYGRKMKADVVERDGDVYADESAEFYFNPFPGQEKPASVYFIAANSEDVVLDMEERVSIGQYEKGWNCGGLSVKSKKTETLWNMELAVPLSSVGLKAGNNFYFNISRNMLNHPEYLNLTGKAYKDYSRMVSCVIKAAPSIAWTCKEEGGAKVSEELNVANLSGTEAKLDAAIESSFQENEKVEKVIQIPDGAEEKLVQNITPGYSAQGTISARVRDIPSDKILFAFTQKLGLANVSGNEQLEMKDGKDYTIEYYPSYKNVNIRFQGAGRESLQKLMSDVGKVDIFVYNSGGEEISRITTASLVQDESGVHLDFSLPCNEDGVYAVKAVLSGKNGDCIKEAKGDIEVKTQPWLNNSIGKERVVIPPFVPMTVEGATIGCLGRKYIMGKTGLPEQILSSGREELTAPIKLSAVIGGSEKEFISSANLEFVEKSPDLVVFKSAVSRGDLKLGVSGRAEYDGTIFYELEGKDGDSSAIEGLSLEIPFNNLKYLHTSTDRRQPMIYMMKRPGKDEFVQSNVPVWQKGYDYSTNRLHALFFPENDGVIWSSDGIKTRNIYGDFLPFMLIGNQDYGLFWFADSDRGWNRTDGKPCFEVIRKGDGTSLKINFISGKASMKIPLKISFALTATPVRPRIKGADIAMKTGCEGFNVTYNQGVQGIRYRDDTYDYVREMKKSQNANGISFHLYFANDLLTKTDPAYQYMKHEWMEWPYFELGKASSTDSWLERRCSSDIEDYACVNTTCMSSRNDYYLYLIDKYMKEKMIDGIYLDNSFPIASKNFHLGNNGGYVGEGGKVQGGYNLTSTRSLLKRIAVTANKYGCVPRNISIHVTGALMPGVLSFSEWWLDGEQPPPDDYMDYWKLPILEVIGAGAWGGNIAWLALVTENFTSNETVKSRKAFAALKLFDFDINWGTINQNMLRKLEDIEREFGIDKDDCEFIGYWNEKSKAISGLPRGIKCSFYLRPGKGALIYISNFSDKVESFKMKVDLKDLDIGKAVALDAETGEKLTLANGELPLEIRGKNFRTIRIGSE